MYVDAPTIAALADEFEHVLLGGRVQDTYEVGPLQIGFEIFNRGRHYLLASAEAERARCLLMPDRLRRGNEKPSPLGMLLRKYVRDARLVAVSQPAWERVLYLDFSGDQGDTRLICELMDRRSNIILTVEGDTILECVKRVGADQNRYRVIMPGKPYVPPPAQNKSAPGALSLDALAAQLAAAPAERAYKVLINAAAGISPLAAREITYRAGGDAQAAAPAVRPSDLLAALQTFTREVETREFSPCAAPAEGGEGYRAFAAYDLTFLTHYERSDSISAVMGRYFSAPVGIQTYDQAKRGVRGHIAEARERVTRKLAALERQAVDDSHIELLRKQGELIYAYGYTLAPGIAEFSAEYEPGGAPINVPLDPTLSPAENAKRYFERYEKAKRAAADVPGLLQAAQRELDYINQLETDLDLAESWPEIEAVREALQAEGYWGGPRTRGPAGGRPGIRRLTLGDGYVTLIGRNAEQNQVLISERAAPDDLWLHARDVPGSHVLIKFDGRAIPEAVIEQAARLAAYYSAQRADGSVEVDATLRRYVRPIKGAGPGMVTYRNERTLTVKPGKPTQKGQA